MNFPFNNQFRAQCLRVVDGDTVDLYVDLGFHCFHKGRFRLLGINAPEMNSKDPAEKLLAHKAKDRLTELLSPNPSISQTWNLNISTQQDPDDFGRWLVSIVITDEANALRSVSDIMIAEGLARVYRSRSA